MASSRTDLCNLALGLLDDDPIQDLDQDEPKARVLRIHLQNSIDTVLTLHRWNACAKRAALSALATAPVFGFERQFTLPGDCLRVLEVVTASSGEPVERWSVEAGRVLLCDEESPAIRYTARVEIIPHLPPWLAEAIAYHLAARTARAITGSDGKGAQLREEFERVVLPEAKMRDSQEGQSNENHPVAGILKRSLILRARRAGQVTRLDNWNLEDIPESEIP